jgi:hypothetical protein
MHLENVLHTATENAIPNHKANGNRNSKKRVRAPWNEEIGQASRRTKQAFHRWEMDGSPKEPRNALCKEMKESKKTLRQKPRQAAARIRENKYNDIMSLQTLISNFSISSSENREQHDQTKPTPSSSTIWY